MKPQVIICGLDQIGYRIFLLLQQQNIPVTGVSETPLDGDEYSEFYSSNFFTDKYPTDDSCSGSAYPNPDSSRRITQPKNIIVGNLRAKKTLIRAGILEAKTLLLASSDDATNLAILTQAKLLNPDIRIVNRLFNEQLGERLDKTLSNHISMSVSTLVAPIFAFAAIQKPAIGQLNLLNKVWPVTAESISPSHPLYQQSLQSLWNDPKRLLLTYEPEQPTDGLMAAMLAGKRLETGDRLIWAELQKPKAIKWSFHRLMMTALRGFNQFRAFSRSMILILIVLMSTIVIAITTYVTNNHGTSVVDALYFSVGMITGAGGQEAIAENSTAIVKIFTATMMLVGAGVIGVFYALLNDFILGTHLQQIWTTTRVPQSGHRIICGLGGVGFRVLNLLTTLGEESVALERSPQSRFVNAARSRNIPVILGDAAVPEILKLANVETAASLLAITSNDAVNLDIAITAKSLAPNLPVFVRIHDPEFASQIQQVFEFEQVICPTTSAASAFAAAAIGGQILGNYTARNGLWLSIATLITPDHPFHARTLKEAASTEGFTPLYAEFGQQCFRGQLLLNMTLTEGIVLSLVMPAQRWENMWEPNPPNRKAARSVR